MPSHRTLIVGVGSIGERHLRCFGNTGRAEVSFCEINDELKQRIDAQYEVKRSYADLDAALKDGHDLAVICAPAHLHVPMAIQILEAGLHVLIEKPLSTSMKNVDRLRQLATESGRVAAVAYVYRAHPAIRGMKVALDSGRFGAARQLVVTAGQNFAVARPAYREIYYKDRATGGGAIQDGLTHLVNAAEHLVGPVDRLAADAAHQVLDGVEVEDTVHLICRHGPVLGCFNLNQYQAPNEVTMKVVCDGGTAECRFTKHLWQSMTEPFGAWREEGAWQLERDDLYINQANLFLDAVEGKAEPLCTVEQGVQTLKVNLAALKAADTHTWQEV